MPTLTHLELEIGVDDVLRGQGADPMIVRKRSPHLITVAERAIQEGLLLIQPSVCYREYRLQDVWHERLIFVSGEHLSGKLVARHLAAAQRIAIILCTIGDRLEKRSAEVWASDMVYSMALDGVGTAAVEALSAAACQYLSQQAESQGLQASIPISPGMIDWSVGEGQEQIFRLLEGEQAGVILTESFLMIPRKSATMVVGIGPNFITDGRACDFCNMRNKCRYQDQYA